MLKSNSQSVILQCPLFVMLPRKTKADKKYGLNLNIYRNASCYLNNEAKKVFKSVMRTQILALPRFKTLSAHYVLCTPTKRLGDTSNVTCIVNKYLQDAIVELGRLPDDNSNYWLGTSDEFGGVDRENPRCDVYLTGTV